MNKPQAADDRSDRGMAKSNAWNNVFCGKEHSEGFNKFGLVICRHVASIYVTLGSSYASN